MFKYMSLLKFLAAFLFAYGVLTINLEAVRKKELIAFTEMAAESAE